MSVQVRRINDNTLAAAYLTVKHFHGYLADSRDPSHLATVAQLNLFSERCLDSGNQADARTILDVRAVCYRAVEKLLKDCRRLDELTSATELGSEEIAGEEAQRAAESMRQTLRTIDRLEGQLRDELHSRLQSSPSLLQEAKDFAGEPSGWNGNHQIDDLANGLLQSAITFREVGRVTAPSRQVLEL